jgi:carbonic anhydrase
MHGDLTTNAIAQNARDNAAKLPRESEILHSGVREKTLRIVSAVYDLKSGNVALL